MMSPLRARRYRYPSASIQPSSPVRSHPSRSVLRVSRSEEHTSELQSPCNLVCRLLLEKKNALTDDRGQSVTEAPPATPVVVSGMSEVPQAGDIFQVVGSEKSARQIALTELTERRTLEAARDVAPRITLEDLARRAKEGEVKELSLVVKAGAQGTLAAVLA